MRYDVCPKEICRLQSLIILTLKEKTSSYHYNSEVITIIIVK